ncbi:chitinase C-terminal domain-containing protein [Shewanella sp. JM162201]|uniref:Chitinase C-terminal domain-containing protein n=1 Tax=Shewanella jiangmenensis TaxID=2837387 RepID=A0ABS5V779_9GAMM|nr:glycosyl hydrolase family 18 protein [Shewanella jiangmenensis]MBT1445805.1 chitinase C-terminal domain-containing protein [Shewanella jiangmenensis]
MTIYPNRGRPLGVHRLALCTALALSATTIHPAFAVDCQGIAPWQAASVYATPTKVTYNSQLYQNKWWTQNDNPSQSTEWGVWSSLGSCDGVSPNQPPVVAISSPVQGSKLSPGEVVELIAAASDPDGTVASISWFANGAAISSPWTASITGAVEVVAKVVDDKGAESEAKVQISVENSANLPPVSDILSPANDSVVTEGEAVLVSVEANDADSGDAVKRVELWVNGSRALSDSAAPWQFSWTPATAGSYRLQSRAFDGSGAEGRSAEVNLTVGVANQAPAVSVSAPANGFTLASGATLTLSAAASDADGSVSSVSFYANGSLIAVDDAAPYEVSFAPADGNLSLQASAVDNAGLESRSVAVTGFVGDMPTDHEACRPEGLVGNSLYCLVYDEQGREKMGADHARRVIGYFTSWRTGKNGQPSYLAKDIPWGKITHINYAFAHIDANNKVSIGNPQAIDNAATNMSWPGVAGAEMDPGFSYTGHFNLLNKFKKQHPEVKTLISIGGWAETGGYFDDSGKRVASGGFYEMTKTQAGIDTFADSVVAFLRSYGFDGADIDYEYASSMGKAGNPDDFWISEPLRGSLFKQYDALMKTLREKLDAAGREDGKHYLLTVAAPASGYLLRGMEAYQMTKYLDYVNIMSYDLHGAWNDFVGHNAPLYDTGLDAELAKWSVYSTAQYGGIGYLNTDWAYHYFRGSLPAGRINIGLPYYTRGWQGVNGGDNGLWGLAPAPDQNACPTGTGEGTANCGYGAQGIDNLWHDLDSNGKEIFAGSNPMWHAKNLEAGVLPSYLAAYGLNAANSAHQLSGVYQRHYDATAVAPWLWNPQKKVFISTEDEESMRAKVQYVVDKGIGGVMFWELAGDYSWYPERNGGSGEFFMGDTLTSIAYNAFASAAPYGNAIGSGTKPAESLSLSASLSGFKEGDNNYPITPTLTIVNQSSVTIPGGAVFEFDISTATSAQISDQSGLNLSVIKDGSNAAGNNIGGLEQEFHRVKFVLPSWKSLAPGASLDGTIKYYLPVSMPSNFTVSFGGKTYGFGTGSGGNGDGTTPPLDCNATPDDPACSTAPVDSCTSKAIDAASIPAYPNFPRTDWAGNPSHALGGDRMKNATAVYEAKWWTSTEPGKSADWDFVCNI